MMQILPHPADVNGHWHIKASSEVTVFKVAPTFTGESLRLRQGSKGKNLQKHCAQH